MRTIIDMTVAENLKHAKHILFVEQLKQFGIKAVIILIVLAALIGVGLICYKIGHMHGCKKNCDGFVYDDTSRAFIWKKNKGGA